ncbi:MAG: SRPBCC domain-containing protein [Pseudomonadota bacterium]|nr:SRPBCC domain-containing protein [Pseudomonadota bacterium]
MGSNSVADGASASGQFTFERTLDAPRDLVWKMWTVGEHLAQWWGPKGCKLHVEKADVRPGGTFHYAMRFSNGAEMWGLIAYQEVEAPSRLAYVSSFSNPGGEVVRAPFSQDFPLRVLNVMTFVDRSGGTRVTLTGKPLEASPVELAKYVEMFGSMEKGFGGTFEQLETYLVGLGR